MEDEEDESTELCGSKGQITLDEQHKYIRAKQQVDASDIECEKYGLLLDETHQQLRQCRERLQALAGRREQAAAQALQAARAGRHASHGYLRDRLAGLDANLAQQQQRRHWLAHRLATLEKYSAAAAFDDGKLVSTKFFVNQMEDDFEHRKQTQKNCYINREEKLAKIYQDNVKQSEVRDRKTLRSLRAKEEQLREQAQDTADRMDTHVTSTLGVLKQEHQQQLLASEGQRQRRSDAVRQFARQLEYTREVIRVQRQSHEQSAAQPAAQPAAPGSAHKLQAHLLRRRAALVAAEQSRFTLAARQRDNTRQIVSRLVQEERRRLRPARPPAPLRPRRPARAVRPRSLPPLAAESGAAAGAGAGPTGSAGRAVSSASAGSAGESGEEESAEAAASCDSTPPAEPAADEERDGSPLSLSAGDRERLQQLLESAAVETHGGSGEAGSLTGSLRSVERQWPLRRPDMPVSHPPVTSKPCPFSWKPDVILFKDFQVGWTYHRRVSIVNLSATRSSCRYIGLYEQDYYQLTQPMAESLRVHFSPPGFLGTGLAARLELEFTPRLLCDGVCLVRFQAPNGEFQVPVRFVAQRCEPRLERAAVEFGDLVLGARVRKSVLLRNTGSKGCRFTFRPLAAPPSRTEDEAEGQGGGSGDLGESQRPGTSPSDNLPPTGTQSGTRPGSSRPDDSRPGSNDTDGEEAEPPASSASSRASLPSSTAVVASILGQLFDRLPIIDFDGGLGVCGSREDELPAGGRARLHLGCVADLEGAWRRQFIVEFDDPHCEPFTMTASYSGHVFPVSVRNPHLSLDICLCGLTYWDNFEIINTGKVASRVQTLVPDDIRPFVEIQGSTALVQADSSFKVKVFFKPKRSLLNPPHRFFDPATHVLDFPVSFHVEGRSVRGSVQAAVSSNHVWLRPERLELGRVTLLESACRRVQLTNGGLTAQWCQFTGLPDSVSVQPGNGGAFLLPGETVPLDVIFSPSVTGQHHFTLVVETLDGGRATVSCRGLATTPALSLSSTSIKMSGVPVEGEMKTAVFVQCPKAPLAEEKFFASGGSFEFQPPEGIPVRIHPMVGFVPYKQSRCVEVSVTPCLEPSEVRVMAALLRYEQLEMEEADRQEEAAQREKNKKKGKSRKKSPDKHQMILCPEPSSIKTGTAIYRGAQQVLMKTYQPTTHRYVIPCCVRHGGLEQGSSGVADVLYLELVCTTAPPHLVSVSPLCLDFGARVLNAPAYLDLELENTAELPVRPRATALDPHGPFRLVDHLGELGPGERRAVRVSYCPARLSQELEFWNVSGGNSSLRYGLYGRGVKQEYSITPEDGALSMGKAKLGKSAKKQIVVTNRCDAPLVFHVELLPGVPVRPASQPADSDAKPRGSGSPRSARRGGRPEPEPESAPPVWAVSAQQLTVEPHRTAALDVLLSPTEEALYEARVVLRLFLRLDEVTFRLVGKTPGYKAPKPEKRGTDKGKDKSPKEAKKSGGKGAKGKEK